MKNEKITACLLLGLIVSISLFYGKGMIKSAYHAVISLWEGAGIEAGIAQFNSEYRDSFTEETRGWIQAYGMIQKILGKREIKNFALVCDDEGNLYTQTAELPQEKITNTIEDISCLYHATQDINGSFLFVQMPYKNFSDKESLVGYGTDYTDRNFDKIVAGLEDKEIPILDLREEEQPWDFFRTDHHWTIESAFRATDSIVKELNDEYSLQLDVTGKLRDIDNYEKMLYPDSLLGSTGIQVGTYYAPKDDFSVLIPKFETSLSYSHYISGSMNAAYEGSFTEALLNIELLNNIGYYNKYNACLYGGWNENRIMNHAAENEQKCLLITNSYGRPMAQYLSLYFRETRYLDPQPGRYNDNYLDYINEYQPDVVIVMYDDEINTTD